MVWTTIPDTDIDADSPVTVALMTSLRDNIQSAFAKDAGAPQLATDYVTAAMIAANAVGASEIAARAVGQSELKSATGVISTTNTTGLGITTPGGMYGFMPLLKNIPGTSTGFWGYNSTIKHYAASHITSSTFAARINLHTNSGTVTALQRYIQASPPYDLGNGDFPMFIFLMVEKATGDIITSYVAQDPPWANNGPTNCHADFYDETGKGFVMKFVCPFTKAQAMADPVKMQANLDALAEGPRPVEVTQSMKQADMPLIPQPFNDIDTTKYDVVVLDPNDKFTIDAFNMSEAFSEGSGEVADLIHESGFFKLNSTPVAGMITPSGVIGVRGGLV